MELKYQDQNLITNYIQIYLKEYYGLSIHKVVKHNRIESDDYELTITDPIKVTGYLNEQTYSSIALYMFRNYPNELYPGLWMKTSSGWEYTTDVYNRFTTTVEDGSHILRKEVIIPYQEEQPIINVIISNIKNLSNYDNSIIVPRRVLSYLLGEVVSSLSSQEEILRVKQYLKDFIFTDFSDSLISSDIIYISAQINKYINSPKINSYIYDDEFKNIIWQLQDLFIRSYGDDMPDKFRDFKATGYVDPWTEHILKGGSESEY